MAKKKKALDSKIAEIEKPLGKRFTIQGPRRGRGWGGGGGGGGGGRSPPPPPPHFFARIKMNYAKNNLTKVTE